MSDHQEMNERGEENLFSAAVLRAKDLMPEAICRELLIKDREIAKREEMTSDEPMMPYPFVGHMLVEAKAKGDEQGARFAEALLTRPPRYFYEPKVMAEIFDVDPAVIPSVDEIWKVTDEDVSSLRFGLAAEWVKMLHLAREYTPRGEAVPLGNDLWSTKKRHEFYDRVSRDGETDTWEDCCAHSLMQIIDREYVSQLMAAFAEAVRAEIDKSGGRLELWPGVLTIVRGEDGNYTLAATPLSDAYLEENFCKLMLGWLKALELLVVRGGDTHLNEDFWPIVSTHDLGLDEGFFLTSWLWYAVSEMGFSLPAYKHEPSFEIFKRFGEKMKRWAETQPDGLKLENGLVIRRDEQGYYTTRLDG